MEPLSPLTSDRINSLLSERENLRRRKLFGRADAILNHLRTNGVVVDDTNRTWWTDR